MTAIPDIETRFRRAARRLTTPLAARFDPAQWQQAFEETPDPTPADAKLLEAALWVGREVQAHNAAHPERFGALSADQAIALGVALLNREYRASVDSSKRERDRLPEDQPVSVDYLSYVRYENSYGQHMSGSDFVEAGIECLASWIFDARRMCTTTPAESADLGSLARDTMYFYSLRRAFKGLFDEALHQGAALVEGRDDRWGPLDRKLAALHKAWLARAEANFMNEAMKLAIQWPDMSPSQRRGRSLARAVSTVVWRKDGWHAKVGRKEYLSGRPDGCAMERIGLRDSYLALFLDEEMPLAPGLTAAMLQDAWWVLLHFVRKVEKAGRAAAARGELTLLQGAFAVTRKELCRILLSALRISDSRAHDIVEFLTFRERSSPAVRARGLAEGDMDKGNRGLWSAPLVPLQDEALLLPQAIFENGAPVYRVEAWLEKGGIDDQAIEHRGDRFEKRCRADLVDAIAGNSQLAGAHISPAGIPVNEVFPYQTDLVFQLGSRAFIGEIKCWLTPADPHHWDRFFRIRLPQAVDQALVRASALRERRDVLANALGIGLDEAEALEICPIIALNLSAGFSLESRGCRIIDADFLRSFLRTPLMTSAIALRNRKPVAQRVDSLYATEQEASDNFDAIMAMPWTLIRFLDRLERTDITYPRPTGGTFSIETLFRGDLTPTERLYHAQVLAMTGDN